MYPLRIQRAASCLQQGGVIAYPTEGVWGLGCDPFNEEAVYRLLAIKQRPVEKGLILVASSMKQIEPLLMSLDASQLKLLSETWPGPFTWLLPDADQLIPPWIKGKFSSVAVRVSAHPQVVQLCSAFGGPLVSTSANPAELAPARSRLRVLTWFGDSLDYILPGKLGGQSGPSTIRDLASASVIRS
ncbi:MAG: Sua5/YciO/YrdC/YwlC family protein [Pseudomonadota bacterium]